MNSTLNSHATPALLRPWTWLQQLMSFAAPRAPAVAPVARVHRLERGDTIEIHEPAHHAVSCLKGTVWVTQDHSADDWILERGTRYQAAFNSRMLLHAIDEARVVVSARRP
jgi:quercetin dioxygenase-like cupin family protein